MTMVSEMKMEMEMEKRVNTSLNIRPSIRRRAKLQAVSEGMDMADYVEAGLILVMDKNKKEINNILSRNVK